MRGLLISVRSGSTRLPQKALMRIRDKTTIEYLIDRVKESEFAEKIVLCTTKLPEDDELCEIASNNGIEFFRGSTEDKLERWRDATNEYDIDFFVNVDGDDIFFDAGLADLCFEQYYSQPAKSLEFIDGRGLYNDVYGIRTSALEKICTFKNKKDTEFIRPFFLESNIEHQEIRNVPDKYKKKDIRMTLDYEEDFMFFKTVIEHFLDSGIEMSFENILSFLEENQEVVDINWGMEEAWKNNQDEMIERISEEGENEESE